MKVMTEKIKVGVTGTVQGFVQEGESEQDARCRLVLEAEMRGNEGIARVYLNMNEGQEEDAATRLLRLIVQDLPSNKDWLDPAVEREARALLAEHDRAKAVQGESEETVCCPDCHVQFTVEEARESFAERFCSHGVPKTGRCAVCVNEGVYTCAQPKNINFADPSNGVVFGKKS